MSLKSLIKNSWLGDYSFKFDVDLHYKLKQ